MTLSTKATIKTFYQTGDFPTQSNFSDFIDSCAFLQEVSAQVFTGTIGVSATISAGRGEFAVVSAPTANLTTINATTGNITTVSASTVNAATIAPTNITGTNTNNNASAGSVGEFISASVANNAVSISNLTTKDVATISLTAGDWDVSGTLAILTGSGTTATAVSGWISSSSATSPTDPGIGALARLYALNLTTGLDAVYPIGTARFSLNTTTTIYLSTNCIFSGGTLTGGGFISARRVR